MAKIELPDYMPLYPKYKAWQDKIYLIGEERRSKGENIGDKRGHLREEYFEIGQCIKEIGITPDSGTREKLIMEIGDIVNVSSIMLALMERRLPLRTMVLKLAVKSDKYGTSPVTQFILSSDYSEDSLFSFWSQEIFAIGKRDGDEDIRVPLLRDRYDVFSEEHTSLMGRLDKLCRVYKESKDTSLKPVILEQDRKIMEQTEPEVREDLGDIINLGAILLSLMSEDVPWERLKKKLDAKDKKFGTGAHLGKLND